MKIFRFLPLWIFFFILTGCGGGATDADYGKLGLVSVSGNISLDGEPLEGAYVQFEGSDLTFSYGTTDAGGDYSLQFNSDRSGVQPGTKTIRIRASAPASESDDPSAGTPENEGAEGSEDASQSGAKSIPDCYNTKSKLTVEVTSSASFDFDLKSDCSTTGAK